MFFCINNSNFSILRKHFSKLKLIARGGTIKVEGENTEVAKFERVYSLIEAYISKYNRLGKESLLSIISDSGEEFIKSQEEMDNALIYGSSGKAIKPRTTQQKVMVEKYELNDLLFAIGPAGTGKTFVAISLAVKALKNKEVKRIILSRPAVEAGEHLGFLPGDMKEKLDPYLQPLYDALLEMIPPKKLADLFEDNIIQIAPLAFMRGRTLSNAFVILDEAQNATVKQMKMFLTRMGENSKFIVTGDITQIDLPDKRQSGLLVSRNALKNIEGIAMIEFGNDDIIRHRLVRHIVDAYNREEELYEQLKKATPTKDKTENN